MMDEFLFKLKILPENYDYQEEDIIYRVFCQKQLVSERSLPILTKNQLFVDSFTLKLEKNIVNLFEFINIKTKKAKIKTFIVDEISYPLLSSKNQHSVLIKGLNFNLKCPS